MYNAYRTTFVQTYHLQTITLWEVYLPVNYIV